MKNDYMKSDMWGTCIWGIDDRNKLYIGEGVGVSLDDGTAPWEQYKSEIVSVDTFGEIKMPEGASLAGMFRNCVKLSKAKLKDLDTSGVTDMSSMFENCEELTDLTISGFDTSSVKDMSKMFSGCKQLANLDLSSFDTCNASNMRRMFSGCSNLHNITLTDSFSPEGDGATSCGTISVRDTGKYKTAKIVNAGGARITYFENFGSGASVERRIMPGYGFAIDEPMFDLPAADLTFKEWNTEADGSGGGVAPGTEIDKLDDDLDLYAIWVSLPIIEDLQPLAEIEYGQMLPFELPEITSLNDTNVRGWLEISESGEEGTWYRIDHDDILPASCNGYLLRLCAVNSVGSSYSNAVRIRIKKAGIDMSKVHWVESEDMTYDGQPKKVWIEGLPDEVRAVYSDNMAIEAGEYSASVNLEYDTENYNIPVRIRAHAWTINKARYDMSQAKWDYTDAFVYDGTEKRVSVTGLPEGVEAALEGNVGVNAGVMTATASLLYDKRNYEKPLDFIPCSWEIKKAPIDTSKLEWSDYSDFVYDGESKRVYVKNFPSDVQVEYTGDEEILAGKYLARASIHGNYYATAPVEYEWEIEKAKYDMSSVKWSYDNPLTYNKEAHEISLLNVPAGLKVRYRDHIGLKAGEYLAKATFTSEDTHNYIVPNDMELKWAIKKEIADMSNVRWNYMGPFTYDGDIKSVDIEGLPAGVYATVENGTASNAGVYTAHAKLVYDDENYVAEQPADCQWQINKAKYDVSDVRWNYSEPFTYDGTEKSVMLVNVPEGLNVEYKDNNRIESGKYIASASLTPSDIINYEIPRVNGCTWSIGKSSLERGEIRWSACDDFVYDGREKEVHIISDISDKIRVNYYGNTGINAGEYTAVAKFYPIDENNYEAPDEVEYTWSIGRGVFNMQDVVWDYGTEFTYDGSRKEVKLLNVPDGLIVHYENAAAIDAGDYRALASFEAKNTGNCEDVPDMTLNWSINKTVYDMSRVDWQEEKSFTYNGTEQGVELVGLPSGLIPVYTGNSAVDADEYLANVDFEYDEINYEKPHFNDCLWRINKADFDPQNASWSYVEPFVYDGTEKSVKVSDLPAGAHIEYGNERATDAGTYIAIADIIADNSNNYNHVRMDKLTWKIVKGEYDMSYAYWDFDKPFTYDGLEKKVVLKGLPEGVFPIYNNNAAVDAGEYEATVTFRVSDAANYNIPSFKSCKWSINKTDCDMSNAQWNYSGEFTYNGRMQEITLKGLPDGLRVSYDGNCATNVGVYRATASIVPIDERNYNSPTVADCAWEIVKADYDMSLVKWDYKQVKTYNEREQSVALDNLPNGVIAEYSGNTATNVGKYLAKATLTVADAANYNIPAVGDCAWEIVHADVDMSGIIWDFIPSEFIYDGSKKTVSIINLPEGVRAEYRGNTSTDAGDYIATAQFDVDNKNYSIPESASLAWSIDKAVCDMSGVKWNYTDEFTYNGKSHSIVLENLPKMIKAVYSNNKAVESGRYEALASFEPITENYVVPEDMSCPWVINKSDIDISSIRWDYDKAFVYDGSNKSIKLAGLPNTLTAEYDNNEAGMVGVYTAHAVLSAVDPSNYTAPVINDCEWEIVKTEYDMSKAHWVNDGPFTYNGKEQGIHLEGLPAGVVPRYMNNTAVDAGEYIACADFMYDDLNYKTPVIQDCKWSISKNNYDLSETKWNFKKPYVYDGTEKTVELIKLPAGLTPKYSNNTNIGAGEYIAEVTFEYDSKNYNRPEFEPCRWVIDKAEIEIDKKTLRWDYSKAFVYDGEPKTLALAEDVGEVSFFDKLRGKAPSVQLRGVPEGVEASYEDCTQTNVGTYFAKAVLRHASNPNYKEYHVTECKWEIKKATLDMSNVRWDYNSPYVYDGEEKGVYLTGLPAGLKASYTGNIATGAGAYEAQADFELEDADNYVMPKPIKGCWWRIDKAKYDMSRASWTYNDDIVYNGKEKTVKLIGLPEGVKVDAYSGNKATEAGSYMADVVFKYKDPDNYEEPRINALRWEIKKKKINTDDIVWNYDESTLYVYDEQVKEVVLLGVPKDIDVVYVNNSKINAGTYVAKARLTYDTKNYEAESIPDCKWTIRKASFDTSETRWDYTKPFIYDAYIKGVSLKNVPNKIDVRYRDNKASAIGTYTAKAYLTYNSDNYNTPDIDTTIEWEIVRAGNLEEDD